MQSFFHQFHHRLPSRQNGLEDQVQFIECAHMEKRVGRSETEIECVLACSKTKRKSYEISGNYRSHCAIKVQIGGCRHNHGRAVDTDDHVLKASILKLGYTDNFRNEIIVRGDGNNGFGDTGLNLIVRTATVP
jgi:hypothetical protein